MEDTPRLYDTRRQVLRQHQNWVDLRHLKTLACMMVGLIQSGKSVSRPGPPMDTPERCTRRAPCAGLPGGLRISG